MKVKAVNAGLPEGRAIRDFKPYMIYIRKSDGTNMQDIWINSYNAENVVTNYAHAQSGRIEIVNGMPTLRLFDVHSLIRQPYEMWNTADSGEIFKQFKMGPQTATEEKTALTDMT